jgi:hypothetical protein
VAALPLPHHRRVAVGRGSGGVALAAFAARLAASIRGMLDSLHALWTGFLMPAVIGTAPLILVVAVVVAYTRAVSDPDQG